VPSKEKISFRRKDPATLAALNLHQNLLEITPASSAENQDISFQTALSGKLKSVLVEDMIQETTIAKARAKATTLMMRRKRRSSSRRRIALPSPRQNLPLGILPSPHPTARIPLARPRRTSARKWIPMKKRHLTPKKLMNPMRILIPAWLA
jgi:hypothetical protein